METCLIGNCNDTPRRRGWCGAHYQRWLKYGDPLRGGVRYMPRDSECEFGDCTDPVRARGLCKMHYYRQRHGLPLAGPPARLSQTRFLCSVDGCERHASARGWCDMHYRRWKKTGDPTKRPPRKKRVTARGSGRGASTVDKWGYVKVYWPEHPNARRDGKLFEHTLVMAELIGRPLTATENVHHRNGVHSDNRPSNLELWNKVQPAGKRVCDLIEYANEIHSLYGTDPTKFH